MAHLELRRPAKETVQRTAEAQRYAEQLQALARTTLKITAAETPARLARGTVGCPEWAEPWTRPAIEQNDGTRFGEGNEAVLVQLAQLAACAIEPLAHPHAR